MLTLAAQKCTFVISFQEAIDFNKFAGSMIRGALGNELKKMLCIAEAGKRICNHCVLASCCVYAALWEPQNAVAETALTSTLNYVPHPYVLDVPFYDNPVRIEKGRHFEFSITLIGTVIKYLPHIILAVENLSKKGIGHNNIRFSIVKVFYVYNQKAFVVYKNGLFNLPEKHLYFNLGKKEKTKVNEIELDFLTPCRIKGNKRFLKEFNWEVFIKRLLFRYSTLSSGYCSGMNNFNADEYLSDITNIKILYTDIEWKEYRRRSASQNNWMTFSGFTGKVKLAGCLSPYMELLRAGEIIHAGKSTTFGLGKYRINTIF